MLAISAIASLPVLPPVRRGGHCIEQNVVSTLSFPRRLQTTNNSISLSSTQFPFGRRARSTQPATIICAAALNARCGAEQTQTVTRQAPTITHVPGKEKSPQLDDGGTGFPPRDDDDGGGGGGGGGGNWSLEEAKVSDLLIRAPVGDTIFYVDIVQRLVEEFVACGQQVQTDSLLEDEFQEIRSPGMVSDPSKAKVAKLVDGYLAEIARDPNLPLAKFVNLAELVSSFTRASHDGLYRAIDMYLKEHPGISKSERKKICRLMNCRNLSAEACMHAVQNERLPMRVVVQVLFFEQLRATTSSGDNSTPDHPGSLRAFLPGGSHGSSMSTITNTEEEWDAVGTMEDIKSLKGEVDALKLSGGTGRASGRKDNNGDKGNADNVAASKMKGFISKKILSKIWSSKEKSGDLSSSDTSESPASTVVEETKSTPSRSRRHSVS